MGIINRFLGGGGGEEEMEEEFDDWETEEEEELTEEGWEDEEEELIEWENSYQFLGDGLQAQGFADQKEFIGKAMMHKVRTSAKYRDRIKTGAQSLQMVQRTMEQVEGIAGGGDKNWGKMAEELEQANRVVEQVENFTDEEDQMVWGVMNMANQFLDEYSSRKGMNRSGESSVERREGEL